MKKVMVTCCYELTYNDCVTEEEIREECEIVARKGGILCREYGDSFYVVEVEEIDNA